MFNASKYEGVFKGDASVAKSTEGNGSEVCRRVELEDLVE